MDTKLKWLVAAVGMIALTGTANADIIPLGSSLTMTLTNFPGACTDTTCTDAVTFSSVPVLIDGGAVSLFETQTPTAGGGEWDVWHLSIVNGGPLAGDINAFWEISMNYVLGQAANFDQVVDQWTVNGVPVSPINNFGGVCCAAASNPILPGESYYNFGFTSDIPAGPFNNWNQIFVTPYSFVSAGGIDPNTANGFNFALHFDPQVPPVPEPASLTVLGSALLALVGMAAIRRGRRHAA